MVFSVCVCVCVFVRLIYHVVAYWTGRRPSSVPHKFWPISATVPHGRFSPRNPPLITPFVKSIGSIGMGLSETVTSPELRRVRPANNAKIFQDSSSSHVKHSLRLHELDGSYSPGLTLGGIPNNAHCAINVGSASAR